jgi:uncharacterized protein (TIGR02996 family)
VGDTVDALLRAIAEAPKDWPRYLIAADAMEEAGDDSGAACLRWLRDGQHAPTKSWMVEGAYLWAGWVGYVGGHTLPHRLFNRLTSSDFYAPSIKRYSSLLLAFDAVIEAWSPEVVGA